MRTTTTARVRLAKLHLLQTDLAHEALLVGDELDRRDQLHDLHALLLGVVQLGATGRHLGLGTTVGQGDLVGAQAKRGARGVHGHVTAAEDHDVLAVLGGRVELGEVLGLHEVHAGEVLVGAEDAGEVLARDVEEAGKARAHAQEHGVKALLLEELLGVGDAAHDAVVLELDAQVLEAVDLALDDGLGQTELGDAVGQHAAAGEEGLEHRDVVAVLGKLAGAGDAGRAGAHHGDLLAVGRLDLGLARKLAGIVAEEALELADCDGLALLVEDAVALALVLLRAHAAADGGEHALLVDDIEAPAEVALANLLDEVRDVDVDRAALHALRLLAVEAAVGLGDGVGHGEAAVDRTEVLGTLGGDLLVVRSAVRLHIGLVLTVYLWHAQVSSS